MSLSRKLFRFPLLFFLLAHPLLGDEHYTFYSSQERRDIKQGILRSLKQKPEEIFFAIYALTDHQIIRILEHQATWGHKVSIWTDTKHLPSLKKKMSGPIEWIEHPQKGLMHHKILLIGNQCFLGSANLTLTSLKMHDNFMVRIDSPSLCWALKKMLRDYPTGSKFLSETITIYLLPHLEVLQDLLKKIQSAQSEIWVAFFTFTHPKLAQALVEAHRRGVRVQVLIDASSSKGASYSTVQYLKKEGIPLFINRGAKLMHHKMCLIDRETFLFGSCNWTQSAFKKNNDFIACLHKLSKKEQAYLYRQFKHLFWESRAVE